MRSMRVLLAASCTALAVVLAAVLTIVAGGDDANSPILAPPAGGSLAYGGTSAVANKGKTAKYAPHQLLVRFSADASSAQRAAAKKTVGAKTKSKLGTPGLELLSLPKSTTVAAAKSTLSQSDAVAYAEPDYLFTPSFSPNDTYYVNQSLWGLNSTGQTITNSAGSFTTTADADIDAPEAWDTSAGGSPNVTVAVLDSGVDYNHPDLAGNIWTNTGETGGGKETNGLDDDSNGKVDDWHGWDFANLDNDPAPIHYHGTHVAGTIAAKGNNGVGVAGVSYNSKIMPLQAFSVNGATATALSSDLIEGLDYAGKNGANVVNGSFGGPGDGQAFNDTIRNYPKTLFVVAAGNDNFDNDLPDQVSFPCAVTAANLVCVAASDYNDAKASFSSYGATSVDLAAPGVNILSTVPNNAYGYLNGTSMATPHVAGAAALLFSADSGATPASVKRALLDTVDPLPAFAGKTVTGGRLNLARAVASVTQPAAGTARLTLDNSTITYKAAAGQANNVSISLSGSTYTLSDPGANVAAGAGCTQVNANQATCPSTGVQKIHVRAGDGNDTVVLASSVTADSQLYGEAGNDSLTGGSGNDSIAGGAGTDNIDGAGGAADAADYSESTTPLTLSLDGVANDGAVGEGDNVSVNTENVDGGSAADTITGSSAANRLDGEGGDDVINGNDGADLIYGRRGSNTLRGGNGNDAIAGGMNSDLVIGGAGADNLLGGDGRDTISYEDRTNPVSITFDATANDGESGEGDVLSADFEVARGGSGADTIVNNSNTVVTFIGGLGADTLTTTNYLDVLSYADRTNAVTVNLGDAATDGEPGEGDVLSGFATILGGAGNDTLIGNDNSNWIDGGPGADVIDGAGATDYPRDYAIYDTRTAGVTVDIDGVADDGSAGEGDNVRNVEGIKGGSGADQLTAGTGYAELYGNGGNDTLTAGAGGSLLQGGQGTDYIVGGAGKDAADYVDHTKGIDVRLDGIVNDGQPGENDVISANVESITGGSGADYLEGDANANTLNGGPGSDTIRPRLGTDTVDGGYTYQGEQNTVTYSERTATVLIDPRSATRQGGEVNEKDYISRTQIYIGGSGNDTIFGADYSVDTLYGGPGNDSLNGLGSDDDLYGDAGSDTLAGGAGLDLVSYENRTAPVTTSVDGIANDGETGENDNIVDDVEYIDGTPYNDTMQGAATVTTYLFGLGGNDTMRGQPGATAVDALIGGPGDDTLDGGPGNDGVHGGLGNDVINGGTGVDSSSYGDATGAVTISPNGLATSGQAGETDRIGTDVENLSGSDFADSLTGNDGPNTLLGGYGNDVYHGEGGDDLLDGGSDGADDIYGGSGSDSQSYDNRWTDWIKVTMNDDLPNDGNWRTTGSLEKDNIHSDVENVKGGRQNNDILIGNDSANTLDGGPGGDTLTGLGGDDILRGGFNVDVSYMPSWNNNDTLNGGDGNDTADYSDHDMQNSYYPEPLTVSLDGVNSNDGTNTEFIIESDIIGTDVENVTGGGKDDVLTGSSGSNVIDGGLGADTINGLGGVDTVSYANRTTPVTATLGDATANDGVAAEGDNIGGDIENVTGGSANDTLSGNASANLLLGGAGGDSLNGLDGTDTLDGQTGNDVFDGGAGSGDTVTYASRTAPVTVTNDAAANDGESGEADNVSAGIETVRGGSGADTLSAAGTLATLFGGDGNDVLSGRTVAGSASYGENGNDTINTYDGLANTADCGAGTADSVTPDSSGDTVTGCETVVQTANVTTGGGTITYNASNGLANNVAVTASGTNFVITDTGSGVNLTAGTGCTRASATVVNCPQSGVTNIVVNSGDGNDSVNLNVTTSAASTANGGDGNDSLTGSTAKQVFSGGNGTDAISYSSRTTALNVSLNDVADDGQSAEADNVKSDVENITTGSGADTITGSGATNVIDSGSGNDTVNAGTGNVADTVNGNGGTDTLTYAGFTLGVTVNIGTSGAQNTVNAGSDTLSNFENLTGGDGNDVLTGNASANTITGGLGADTISALAGTDTILIKDGVNDLSTSCGSGFLQFDTVTADKTTIGDPVNSDCETVNRP
jgi:Ca2+-binding RTX toxin-like protein